MTTEEENELYTRDGHLTDLTIDRFLYDEPTAELQNAVKTHLDGCEQCKHQIASIRSFDSGVELKPRVSTEKKVPFQWLNEWVDTHRNTWFGVAAIAAALVLVIAQPEQETKGNATTEPSPGDVIRFKGSALDFEVYADNGKGGLRLDDGDSVTPGTRLAFRLRARQDGYVAILGRDKTGQFYRCYPQDGETAPAFKGGGTATQVDASIELDRILGEEHLTSIWCPTAFNLNTLEGLIKRQAELPAECIRRELKLVKKEDTPK